MEALNSAALGLTTVSKEQEPSFYLVRLAAFGLIIAAIVDKNRAEKPPKQSMRQTSPPATQL
jgi:hypothetical protein